MRIPLYLSSSLHVLSLACSVNEQLYKSDARCIFHCRYSPSTTRVTVPHADTVTVNFTLKQDDTSIWSDTHDFAIRNNIATTFLSNAEMDQAMAQLENESRGVAELMANENEWSTKVHALRIADPQVKGYSNELY